jgi:hypothetical protein
MADMNFSGWIREHLQKVVLFFAGVFCDLENALIFPYLLPFLFQFLGFILVFHDSFSLHILKLSTVNCGETSIHKE